MKARRRMEVMMAMFWRKRMTLHMTSPRIHVSVTSHTTVGGMHTKIRRRSQKVKLARKRLVVWLEVECFLLKRLLRMMLFPNLESFFFGSGVSCSISTFSIF